MPKKMTHLSLFTGIGGLDLAAEKAGFVTVGQCEWADYPTKVLEKHWPDTPRWRDIRTLTRGSFYERTGLRTVDIISGGFPCQPFSVAGKQRGKEDDRYLWPEMVRIIKELRPTWVVGENVAGIVRMALPDILSELESCGYRTRTFLIPACAVGARHIRCRVAIVGCAEHNGLSSATVARGFEKTSRGQPSCENIQYPDCAGRPKQHFSKEPDQSGFSGGGCDEGDVCNPPSAGLPNESSQQVGRQGAPEQEPERSDRNVSNPNNGSRVMRRDWELSEAEETERPRNNLRGRTQKHEPGEWRPVESPLGGVANGFPAGMDRDFLINHYWDADPDIPRIASGIKHRVDRIKSLGNAVVPQQFYPVFAAIAEIERTADAWPCNTL